jgi:hypothetical protein
MDDSMFLFPQHCNAPRRIKAPQRPAALRACALACCLLLPAVDASAGNKMLMLDQKTKRADIPFRPLAPSDRPEWLGKLAYDAGYFKIVAHTYVIPGAEGDMYCGFTGDAWAKEQASIVITATARNIDALPSPIEVPIYTRDTTRNETVCTGSELSVADVMPFVPLRDSDDFGTLQIAFKYSDNRTDNLAALAKSTSTLLAVLNPAAAITTPLTMLNSNSLQTLSSSYNKVASVSAADWVTLTLDYKSLRDGIDGWQVPIQVAERSMGSSFIDIINNPEKYQKKIKPVLRVEFKVVYAPSIFTFQTERRADDQYYPKIDPGNKNILAGSGSSPVPQQSLQMRLNADSPSAIVKLARETSCSNTLQNGCDEIKRIIDPTPLTLLDKAIWYNAALSQVNENWGTDAKFMKSNCITAGARDYSVVLEDWFPGTINIIKLSDVEYARRTARTFTQATQKLFPEFAHALLQTQVSPAQAEVELRDLLGSNVLLRPMSVLFADNLADRNGFAEANAVLSQLKVKQAGCFYQAPHQVGSNEGFMVLVLNDRSDALKAQLKFAGGRIAEIALQDINTSFYKSDILNQDWNNQSTCRTEIIPALLAPPAPPVVPQPASPAPTADAAAPAG